MCKGLNDKTGNICRPNGEGNEDVELGKCMENLRIKMGDTRDASGKGRFFPLVPEKHLNPGLMDEQSQWYRKNKFYNSTEVVLSVFLTKMSVLKKVIAQIQFTM